MKRQDQPKSRLPWVNGAAIVALSFTLACFAVGTSSFAAPKTKEQARTKSKEAQGVTIGHRVPKELPRPGAPLMLEVELLNARPDSKTSIQPTVQIIFSRDGEFTTLPVEGGLFNERDNPSFRVAVPAPEAVLSYQFIARDSEGAGIASSRYEVQRACREPLTVATMPSAEDAKSMDPKELLVRSVQTSEALQYDIQDLKRALGTLQELTEVLNQ